MKLTTTKVSIPVLMMMLFQSGHGMNDWFWQASYLFIKGQTAQAVRIVLDNEPSLIKVTNPDLLSPEVASIIGVGPVGEEDRARQREEIQSRIQELANLGGNSSILDCFSNGMNNWEQKPQYEAAINRADAEIARLKKEAEIRRQQEEARARQEAEQRRQEEEARAKREAELIKQQEEERAKQAEEVQLRMRDLENLGGNPAILNKFANGTRSPEEVVKYRAALNRADAEIVRLRKESDLNKQNMIDQLTEELESQKDENRELRDMIEQLRKRMENLEKGNQ